MILTNFVLPELIKDVIWLAKGEIPADGNAHLFDVVSNTLIFFLDQQTPMLVHV